MKANLRSISFALAVGFAMYPGTFRAQQGTPQSLKDEVAMREALEKEVVRGDLKGAIAQYNEVATSKDRALAVKALLRVGNIYQRLGDAEATKTYARIAREFPDQASAAAEARSKLAFEVLVPVAPNPFNFSLSPDGRTLAYVAYVYDKDTPTAALWVRSVSSPESRMLPGTEGAKREVSTPFWSPDGRYIAYASCATAGAGSYPECAGSGVRLKKVGVSGGAPQLLVAFESEAGSMRRGVWGRDDTILVASGPGIRKVSASGSVATDVTSLDGSLEEIGHSSPWFLPDNRHFLFKTSSESGNAGIYVGSLTSTSRSHVITVDSRAVYSEGFILFVRPTRTGIATLLAQRFDTDRLRLTGEATPIADDLLYDEKFQLAGFETSADGTLIYRTAAPSVISIRTGNSIGPANRDSSPIKIIRNWTSLLKP